MGMLGRPGQMQPDQIELGLDLPGARVFVIGSELSCQLRALPIAFDSDATARVYHTFQKVLHLVGPAHEAFAQVHRRKTQNTKW